MRASSLTLLKSRVGFFLQQIYHIFTLKSLRKNKWKAWLILEGRISRVLNTALEHKFK